MHEFDGHAYQLKCLQVVSAAQGQAELVQLTPAAGVALQRRQPFLRLLLGAAQCAPGDVDGTQQASDIQPRFPMAAIRARESTQVCTGMSTTLLAGGFAVPMTIQTRL